MSNYIRRPANQHQLGDSQQALPDCHYCQDIPGTALSLLFLWIGDSLDYLFRTDTARILAIYIDLRER